MMTLVFLRPYFCARLKKTARSIGLSPLLEGAGLIDAASATDPECQEACFSHSRRAAVAPR
jgi:hypothetical protein